MNNILYFMGDHPILSFFLGLFVVMVISTILEQGFRCWNRLMRAIMVRKQGWPPAHLDADGDWRPERPAGGNDES